MLTLKEKLHYLLNAARVKRSDVMPSVWAEQNRIMRSHESSRRGPFSYDYTPYTRKLVDYLHPSNPVKVIGIKKGAQLGFSRGLIENGIGWIMSENPGNIMYLVGHSDLVEKAVAKLDSMITGCNIRHLVKSNVVKAKNNRTGDTNRQKEFPGGSLITGSATNHKELRQVDIKFGFYDDFEAVKAASKQSGSTFRLIMQRHASYYDSMKAFFNSTPELKIDSNIDLIFDMGDQQYYNIHCRCCHEPIVLEWEITIDEKEKAGMWWKYDNMGRLDKSSVGYICQKCGGFFDDSNKLEQLQNGLWVPTAIPVDETFASHQISSLYAPPGMFDWAHYVQQYLEANPPGQPRNEALHQTFVNVVLGLSFEPSSEMPKAGQIQKNQRVGYTAGVVPNALSIKDGNGPIVLLTCAADMNGVMDEENGIEDGRLDYQVLAWAANGAKYSVAHGSIGTFIPREGQKKDKADRAKYTYALKKQNSVWPYFDKLLEHHFPTDDGGSMQIEVSGLDCGHFTSYAYAFLDTTQNDVLGLRGDKADGKYRLVDKSAPWFKAGQERVGYWLLDVNRIKDVLSQHMRLQWNPDTDESQPVNFMNFPQGCPPPPELPHHPEGNLYAFANFFEHFEAEQRKEKKDALGNVTAMLWEKKTSAHQNHQWDCYIYNLALREIMLHQLGKQLKLKDFTWADFVKLRLGE